jgi:Tfp pilus assembly protein PilF
MTQRLASAAVFVLALLLYANTLPNGFVLDDSAVVTEKPLLRDLARVPELFVADYWEPTVHSGLYRPLVTTSYALNHAVGGEDPRGYHTVNVGLHAIVSVLVLRLFWLVTANAAIATTGALLFAAHAVHTEAVAGVVGRAELLGAVFFLAALLLHAGAWSGNGRGRWRLAGSLACYGLGLLCKENVITLPGAILLYDFVRADVAARRPRARLREIVRRRGVSYAGLLAMSLAYLGIRHLVIASGGPVQPTSSLDNPLVALDPPLRILNALLVAGRYLGLLLFPLHLSYDYSFDRLPLLQSFLDLRALGVLALVVGAVVLVRWSHRRSPALLFAVGLSAVTFSIVSNVVVPIGTILGERLLYLPSVGFCLALALGLHDLSARVAPSPKARRAAFSVLVALVVLLHGGRTWMRNLDWRSDETLFLHDLPRGTRSAKIRYNAGAVLLAQKRYEQAIEQFAAAAAIRPDHPNTYDLWGTSLVGLGRTEDAIRVYQQAVDRGSSNSMTYNNLGFLLVEDGQEVTRGIELLETAVKLAPDNPHVLDSLGWAYYRIGRLERAYELVERSLEIEAAGPSGGRRSDHLDAIERARASRRASEAAPAAGARRTGA